MLRSALYDHQVYNGDMRGTSQEMVIIKGHDTRNETIHRIARME